MEFHFEFLDKLKLLFLHVFFANFFWKEKIPQDNIVGLPLMLSVGREKTLIYVVVLPLQRMVIREWGFRAQSPLNHFYTWCSMLLPGLHHSPVVSVPLLLPTNSSTFPLHLPPLLLSLVCTGIGGTHHHHQGLPRRL